MMKVIDYIVYRLYVVYEKHKDPGRLSAFAILMFISLIGLIFLGLYIDILARDKYFTANTTSDSERFCIFLGVIVADIIFFFSRYTGKRIERMKAQFKGSPWNKMIPAWFYLMLPVFEIAAGMAIYYILKKYY